MRLPALQAFSGKSEEYETFRKKLTAYFIAENEDYKSLFQHAEAATEPINDSIFTEDEIGAKRLQMSRQLHHHLVQLCQGTAFIVLQQCDTENGVEEWRLLHSYYKRPSMSSAMGRLTQILDYNFKNLEEDFMNWEAEIHKFESETSSLLPTMVKTAILNNYKYQSS